MSPRHLLSGTENLRGVDGVIQKRTWLFCKPLGDPWSFTAWYDEIVRPRRVQNYKPIDEESADSSVGKKRGYPY